jgi:putative sigma-54 modulation protein
MYSSIDLVSAKIERQVRRYKEKLRTHKVRELEPVPVVHSVVEEAPQQVTDEARPHDTAAEQAPVVVKRETYHAEPMSASEAIMQLNLIDAAFLIFRNDQTGLINVVYKRNDGAYGLIETAPVQ